MHSKQQFQCSNCFDQAKVSVLQDILLDRNNYVKPTENKVFDRDLNFQNHILLLQTPDSHLSQFHTFYKIFPLRGLLRQSSLTHLIQYFQFQNQRNWQAIFNFAKVNILTICNECGSLNCRQERGGSLLQKGQTLRSYGTQCKISSIVGAVDYP